MAKVFKDKENTEYKLNAIAGLLKAFEVRNPSTALLGYEALAAIRQKSQMAHSSTMHYNTYISASLLEVWAVVYNNVAAFDKWVEDGSYTKDELVVHYPTLAEDTKRVLVPFLALPTEATDWVAYHEAEKAFFVVQNKASDAVRKAGTDRYNKILACLDGPFEAGTPVTKQQHEVYAKLLEKHDYYFDYSDDQGVWRSGRDQRAKLDQLAAAHPHFSKMLGILNNMYNKKAPMDSAREQWAIVGLDAKG